MKNTYGKIIDVFKKPVGITPRKAHLVEWESLSTLCTALLIAFLERPFQAEATREEDLDCWYLLVPETPLSEADIEALFEILGADDFAREANDFGEYPVKELSQTLGCKLVATVLPFAVASSHATSEGVWFMSEPETQTIALLVSYPETDCSPDILFVPTDESRPRERIIDAFHNALLRVDSEGEDIEKLDRLARFDAMHDTIEHELGVKIPMVSVDYEGEIPA